MPLWAQADIYLVYRHPEILPGPIAQLHTIFFSKGPYTEHGHWWGFRNMYLRCWGERCSENTVPANLTILNIHHHLDCLASCQNSSVLSAITPSGTFQLSPNYVPGQVYKMWTLLKPTVSSSLYFLNVKTPVPYLSCSGCRRFKGNYPGAYVHKM